MQIAPIIVVRYPEKWIRYDFLLFIWLSGGERNTVGIWKKNINLKLSMQRMTFKCYYFCC